MYYDNGISITSDTLSLFCQVRDKFNKKNTNSEISYLQWVHSKSVLRSLFGVTLSIVTKDSAKESECCFNKQNEI